ncbi:MAG: FHA domain-containing protein [Christensenellales bacterium]|jgi:pkn9 associate protein 1
MNVTKIKICPKCKGRNPAHLVECGTCGFDLMNVKITDSTVAAPQTPKSAPVAEASMVRICSECGTENVAQARKCTKCGEDISDIRPTCKQQDKAQDKAQEKTGRFCLSSVEGDYAFDLLTRSGSVFLGRTAGMSGYLKDKAYVGRRQAKLTFEAGKVFIENISETNPTFLNNAPLERGQRVLVKAGDEIGLGGMMIDGKRQGQAAYFVLKEK